MRHAIRVRLLGPVTVYGPDGPVGVGGRRAQRLLATLALAPARPVSVTALWTGEALEGIAEGTLAARLNELRLAGYEELFGAELRLGRAGAGTAAPESLGALVARLSDLAREVACRLRQASERCPDGQCRLRVCVSFLGRVERTRRNVY